MVVGALTAFLTYLDRLYAPIGWFTIIAPILVGIIGVITLEISSSLPSNAFTNAFRNTLNTVVRMAGCG